MFASVFRGSSGDAIEPHFVLLLLASLVGPTTAFARPPVQDVDWRRAAATRTSINDINKWAHLQTSHRPTDAPKLHYGTDLRRRELSIVSYATTSPGSNTCGFYTDDGQPMECYEGYTCANIGNIRDCCAADDCKTSSFSSVCLDHTDPACSTYSPGTMCCGGENDPQAAYCATWIWGTSAQPKQLFTIFVCEEKQYAGNFSLWAEEPIFVSDATVTTSTRSPLPIPTSNEGTAAPPTATSGPNIGAIVGGVIGGVAVIGILLLVFYYLRNRSRRQIAAATAAAGGAGSGGGEKRHSGYDGYGPPGNGPPTVYNSPPPPSESHWGAPDGTVSTVSPEMTGTTAMLTPEQQPLFAGHPLQQYQHQQPQQWHGQAPQQFQNQLQQEEADRGMAIGMAMGMNAMKQKSPIEMSNSPTSYEVSTTSLYQELSGTSSPPRPNAELPG